VLTDALMPEVDGFTLAAQIAADPQINAVKIVLLTSAGSPSLGGRRAAMFAATLVKPVKQSELLDAIVTAFAAPDAAARRRRAKPARRSRRAGRALRVLVAEDNPTNQKLVSVLLDQQGHHVTIVDNGRLAVERAAQEPFDIILMDVQMPEMSGLEATAAIREAERPTGRHIRSWRSPPARWPATANNVWPPAWTPTSPNRCGRKSCSRPSTRFAGSPAPSPETPAPVRGQTNVSSVDRSALLAGFGGRADLVKKVIDVFLIDAPVMLTRLNEAARASNAADIAAAAHAIKGSAGLFSQGEAYVDARALELRARSGDISAADRACQAIEHSVSRLMKELERIRRELT
jgi:CheY-like chemotaxis protein/HPt (histidine-containing phosphotransfer) domain-containing protein